MKITVDRTHTSESNLVFTITVSSPHLTCFGESEKQMMKLLEICQDDIERVVLDENKLKDDIKGLIHSAKEKAFVRVLDNLKFSIENEFRPMFKPICQEIYNWIQDHQSGDIKNWMIQFDPQRTKYYFHNDPENPYSRGPSTIPDDKIDEDEEDDDDDYA